MQSLAAQGGARRRTPLEGGWSHDDPSTGFRRRLGLTYDWDLVGNETLPAALLERAARSRKRSTYASDRDFSGAPEHRGVRPVRSLRAALRRDV